MTPTIPDDVNVWSTDRLPGFIGIIIDAIESGRVSAHMVVRDEHLAPNGYLHAAAVIALADTACGYGAMASLPSGAVGFTTIELKSNFLATAKSGARLLCSATMCHGGSTTQVWDAKVEQAESGRVLALFRCTQLVIRSR